MKKLQIDEKQDEKRTKRATDANVKSEMRKNKNGRRKRKRERKKRKKK